MHDFRKLEVYRRALRFTRTVRRLTSKFPKEERFVLTPQFRKAADSIVLNIAEGAGCGSKKEFSKFLGYSIRSGYECGGCSDIAATQNYMDSREYQDIIKETNEIVSMLIGLQRTLCQ